MTRLLPSMLLTLLVMPAIAHAQFKGMRPRIPVSANTLILINAEKMFGSPVADRERWQARRQAAYDAGLSALPPDATEVIIAGQSDHEFGESIWELGLVNLRSERNVTTVAARFGGSMDEINGRSAARLPNDHFVVQISPTLLGAYTPANRQSVSRWLRSTDKMSSDRHLSPYLQQAFVYATKVGSPIVMAMDIEGVVSPAEVKQKLASYEIIKKANLPVDQVASLIAGAHGITLAVSMQEQAIGAIRVMIRCLRRWIAIFRDQLLRLSRHSRWWHLAGVGCKSVHAVVTPKRRRGLASLSSL